MHTNYSGKIFTYDTSDNLSAQDFSNLFIQINVVLHNTSSACHTTASMEHGLGFRKMFKSKAADAWCLVFLSKRIGIYVNKGSITEKL